MSATPLVARVITERVIDCEFTDAITMYGVTHEMRKRAMLRVFLGGRGFSG